MLLFVLVAALYRLSELRIMYLALLVSLVGLAGLSLFGTLRAPAIILIVLRSTGEHLLMPLRQSMAIHIAGPGKEGLAMGGVSSLSNTGTVTGYYLVPLLLLFVGLARPPASAFAPYATVFVAGALVLLAAASGSGASGCSSKASSSSTTFSRSFSARASRCSSRLPPTS